jgi:ferredoxin-NADP reductase
LVLKLTVDAYSRVVTLATGAGIAPCIPQIDNATSNIYLIWLAKDHQNTYGSEVWNAVSKLPSDQLVLHDTEKMGRPNAAEMIQKAVEKHQAEAVFIVSNDRYTKAIIQVCWRMGIRCYGATRDS